MSDKHTISCLVENHFGVLARVAGLISARGFNIDSLTVSATEDPTISRMTIVVDADAVKLEQVKRQLDRLIDVIDVKELSEGQFIDRELLLVRVKNVGHANFELEKFVNAASSNEMVVSTTARSPGSLVVQAIGDTKKLDQLVEQLRAFGIEKLVRTGRVALEKA